MATTTRARAGSMTHGSFSGVGGSSATASHGLGISHLGPASSSSSSTVVASSQQPSLHLQCKESVFGQGQAHNDGRRSIVALQQHSQHRRSTTTAMRPLLVGGRQSSAGLGQLREDGEEGEGAVDESRLDAEEVLRALSVSEARRVEARLRSLALSKQQELRTMVGERYRDLLSSSEALGTLFDASERLSTGLGRMRELVGDVSAGEIGLPGLGTSVDGGVSDDGVGEELALLLPLASQTKLLLDAPELIYRFLEAGRFLPASYLYALCRLVHSEIAERATADEDGFDELTGDYGSGGAGRVGALVEGQWETLQGLRAVISDRARASLRESAHSPAIHAQTLIALVQLDSLSLSSALQLLLSLRLKLLSSLLPAFSPSSLAAKSVHIRHSSKDGGGGSSTARSGSTSRARSRPGSRSTSRAPSRAGSRAPSRAVSRAPSRDVSPSRRSVAPSAHGQEPSSPRRPVKDVVREAVAVIVGTVRLAREVFGPPMGAGSSASFSACQSTLEQLVKAIEAGEQTTNSADAVNSDEAADQVGGLLPSVSGDGTARSAGQRRRDSRLASLSMPFSFPSSPAAGAFVSTPPRAPASSDDASAHLSSTQPLITTRGLIQTLPSSPLLLRYLPRSILDYTPYLLSPSASSPALASALTTWLKEALHLLATALEGLVGQLTTVRAVWTLRAEMTTLLDSLVGVEPAEKAEVASILSAAWDGRVRVIWDRQLAGLQSALSEALRLKLAALDQKEGEGDVHPPFYLFAPSIPFPSLSTAASTSTTRGPAASLPTFRTALRKRVAGRTPLVEAVVHELETLASALRDDIGVLRESADGTPAGDSALERAFGASAREALDGVVRVLKAELEEANGFDLAEGIRRELFLGRVAVHLCVSKTFERDVLVFDGPSSATTASSSSSLFADHLMDVHSLSLTRWREHAVSQAVSQIERGWLGDARVREMQQEYMFKPSSTDASISMPAAVPSPSVLSALHSLVAQLQSLGLPPSVPLDAQGLKLYAAFASRSHGLTGWSANDNTGPKERVARAADALFLSKLVGEGLESQAWGQLVDKALEAAVSSGVTSSALLAALSPAVLHGLQRSQTLLLPILPLPTLSTPPAVRQEKSGPQKATWLLPFSAPPAAQGGGEVVSALSVAAPSPRFGLLAVGR